MTESLLLDPTPQLQPDVPDREAARDQAWIGQRGWLVFREQLPFLVVAFQFCLIVQLVLQFHLESVTFGRLMILSFVGFVIHHYIPIRFRWHFFGLFSVAATVAVARIVPGLTMVAIGLGLIGICHLPIKFSARVVLLVAVGALLTLLRAQSDWFPALERIWPILASMFVFRILVYMYDLKHHAAPFSFSRAISYFFMVPNVCFPLFPVVDYKTFCTTYYNDESTHIYQSGIKWMYRGVIQLLLYRLVYHFGPLNIADVADAKDVAGYAVATYLLYLHVSGQFHLIVGLLHMFGFNLPETHHRYLLASSFTDFWRRINVYWKDFIMKLFFYPAFFAMRRLGTFRAMALATLWAFFATWALHGWQWFWFLGHFTVSWQDVSFWSILAVLVLVNALQEAVSGRRRTLSKPRFDMRARLWLGLKTVGTFVVICALWTLWSCRSMDELQVLADSAAHLSWGSAAIIIAGLAFIGVAGMVCGDSTRESSAGGSAAAEARPPFHFWRSALATGVCAACVLALPAISLIETTTAPRVLAALRQDQLNAGDVDWQRRGYYEELDMVRANYRSWGQAQQAPPDWTSEADLFQKRDDFLRQVMAPSASGILCGTPATTNRWGMRDREYEKEKPAGAYRLVLLGSSHEVGSGVKDDETFENLVEDRLNRESSGTGNRYEILNLSVGGYGVLRKLVRLERDGFLFSPDAVIFCINAGDRRFDPGDLTSALRQNLEIPYPYLNDVIQRARVDGRMEHLVIDHRLQPFVPELYNWAFKRLADQCFERGIRVFVLYRPAVVDSANLEPSRRREIVTPASNAGLEVLDLSSAFDRVKDPSTLVLAPWDGHANATGHQLLADKLYEQLAPRLARPGGTTGATTPSQSNVQRIE